MAADGQVRERVYRELKRKLVESEFALDQHLDLRLLCAVLEASPTPVKEALVRLSGERLVLPKEKGFQVARWSGPQLASLYAWRWKLLVMALDAMPAELANSLEPPDANYPVRIRQLFEAVEAESGEEHRHVAANADDRLSYARIVEPELWPDTDDELVKLGVALRAREAGTGADALRAYFTRRIEQAQAIRDRAIVRSHPNGD